MSAANGTHVYLRQEGQDVDCEEEPDGEVLIRRARVLELEAQEIVIVPDD